MTAPARAKARSFDDLYREIRALPEGKTGMILEPGELSVMSRPHARHQRAMQGIRRLLAPRDLDAGGSGWWLLSEVEVRLPDDRLVVPDILGYRVARVPELPDDNPLRVVPDWCCEILSPGTAREDRLKKLRIYAQHRVEWTWIVDPALRSIEYFEITDNLPQQSMIATKNETATLPPFDLPLSVDSIWGVPGA